MSGGIVAAGHRESARAGAAILARGGNAVDAAAAAACAASMAENPLTGPGAGGFLLFRPPKGAPKLIDFFVQVPGLGPDGRRLDEDMLDSFTVPFGGADQVFHIGAASVAVPGFLHGIAHAVENHGRLSLAEIVEPVCRLARDGVRLTAEIDYLYRILGAMLVFTPESQAVYAPGGTLLAEGDVLRIPELAETFEIFAAEGARAMSHGSIGQAILRHLGDAGLVTETDLHEYHVIEREPLHLRRADYEVITNAPPSAGGILILAALATIDPATVATDEGFYRAVADGGVAANELRDDAFLDALREPGVIERILGAITRKPTGTTNVSVIDADGGMATLSSSLGSGGGVVVPGTGILLNNMSGEQDLNPAGFGLIEPGLRMTSMMSPTLVIRDSEPALALGSAGSNRLRSAILQTLVSVMDGGLDVASAVDRARVHPEDGRVDVEFGVPEEVCAALERDGHVLRRWDHRNLFFGGVSAVTRRDGVLSGAGDPRRGGAAAIVTADGEVRDL